MIWWYGTYHGMVVIMEQRIINYKLWYGTKIGQTTYAVLRYFCYDGSQAQTIILDRV